MRSRGTVEDTQTESLAIRQAKLDAVAEYEEGLESDERMYAEEDALGYVENMFNSLSLYSVFGDKLQNINGTAIEADILLTPEHNFEYGFDDIEEVDKIRERARIATVQAKGTKYEGTARAMYELVDSQTGDLINELVQLEAGSENMTF